MKVVFLAVRESPDFSCIADGSYAIMEALVLPQSGPPMHRCNRDDESWYVIEGQFLFSAAECFLFISGISGN